MDTLAQNLFEGIDASYRRVFEHNPLPMWLYDVQSLRLLAANHAAQALYGYSAQEFLDLSLTDLHLPEDVTKVYENLKLPLLARVAQRSWNHRHRSGAVLNVEIVTQDLTLGSVAARMVMVLDRTSSFSAEQKQREGEQLLAKTLENISDAFLMLDKNGCFTYVNARAEAMLRSRREELLGASVWEKFPDAIGTVFQTEYERLRAGAGSVNFEAFYAPLDAWISVTAYTSATGTTVYFRDISLKHKAEQNLLEERQTLAAVINATTDAIISTDVEGRIKMFNPGAERIFGHKRESMLGKSVNLLLPPGARAAHPQRMREFSESGTISRTLGLARRVKGLRADGRILELEATISKLEVQGQQLLIACLRDITERVRLDAEAQRSQAQLTELTQRLMSQERSLIKSLAQTLHDQLGQTMAAIRMTHETILTLQSEQGPAPSPGIVRLQGQMGMMVGQAIAQVRQVLVDLRPPLLEEQGFAAALDNELRNRALTQPLVDIAFHVVPETAQVRWPAEVEYAAFMVAREAVENALRHSGSPSVVVRLSGTATALELAVLDDGEGIMRSVEKNERHLGILGMHERAQMIGATVSVDSSQGRGTRVNFNWPAKK